MADIAVASFTPAGAPLNAAPVPVQPQAPTQTAADGSQDYLALISHYESGNRNIPNYRYDPQHTAQGYFQITNSNWSKIAPQLGIDTQQYPNAMSAPRDVQAQVAEHLLTKTPAGIANWSAFNPQLHAALDSSGLQTSGAVTPQGSADRSAPVAALAPAAPAAAAPVTGDTAQNLLERLSAGEDIDVTPEMLNRIMLAPPQALQPGPTPAKAPAPVAVAGFTPAVGPPLQDQGPQTPALLRYGKALGESSGATGLWNLITSGPPAAVGRLSGLPDYANEERFMSTLKGLLTGLAHEPGRMSSELQKGGEALLNGDINGVANSLFYALPFAGGTIRSMADAWNSGDYATALGHLSGLGTQILTGVPEARAGTLAAGAEAAELPGRVAGAVSETPVGKAAGAVPVFVKGAAQAAPGAFKSGLERGAEAIVLGPHAAVVGAKIGIAKELAKGGINAVKEYWKGAAPEAEAAPAAAAAAPEAAAAAGPLQPGDTVQWQSQGVDQFQQPRRIRGFSDDGKYAFVEGTNTGIPVEQLSRQAPEPHDFSSPSPIITPPPADTSYVRAVPAQYPEVEPGFTPPTPPPAPQPQLTVEDLGRSILNGKSPAKWTEAERATVQSIHQRITQGLPEEPPPPRALPPDQAAQLFPHVDFGTPATPSPAAPEAPAAPAPTPEAPPAAEAPSAAGGTGLGQLGEMGQAITGNMYRMLWDKVQKGDVTEAGAPSALLQAAKAVRDRGGLQTIEDLKALSNDYAMIPRDKYFRNSVQNLIDSHSPVAEAPAVHPTVQRYTDYLIANGIPGKMVDQFRPQEWELLAPQVNPAAPEVPTAEMATAIRKNIADFEAKPTTPAELQAKADTFNAAKAAQTPPPVSPRGGGAETGPVAATPTPSAAPPSPAGAPAMPEFTGTPPAGTAAGEQPLSLQDLMRGAQTKETAIQTAAQAYRQANRQGNAIKLAEALYNRGTGSADAAQMAVEDLQKLAQTLDVAKKTKSWDLLKQETVLRLQQLEKTGAVSQRQAFEEARADTMAPNAETGNANVSGTGRQVQAPAQPGNRVKPQTGPAYSGTGTSLRIPGESAAYPARYVLRELDDIQASHNPHNFQPNPDYALRNDRNYSDPANQERIVLDSQPGKFAPEYLLTDSPDAVNGPPVVEPGGNVVGGNSRAMKLARVYANNPADAAAYRNMLEQRAGQFGIDPAQVKTMRRPVLVRELASVAGDPQKLVTDLNKTGTAALTAAERATADARRLSGATAEYLGREIEAEGPEATLNDALSGKRGAGIVNKLVEEGIFTPQEKPALVDSRTGAVTAAAKERISKMLLGQVFADSDQMMRTPAEIRNKLERVVSPILQSSARPAYNLIPTVREALNLLEYARAHGIPNLSDAMRQEGLFGGEPDFSAEVARMGQFLKDAKPTVVAKAFRRYMANTESGMFGESTPEQAFDDAFAPPAK